MSDYQDRLKTLNERLNEFEEGNGESEDEDAVSEREKGQALVQLLKDACLLVREAESSSLDGEELAKLVDGVNDLLSMGVEVAYGDEGSGGSYGFFDFMPSFAHTEDSLLAAKKKQLFSEYQLYQLVPTMLSLT